MNGGVRISEDELRKALAMAEEKERKDPKKKWVARMLRSAKQHHKGMCPYYDRKTKLCFVAPEGKVGAGARHAPGIEFRAEITEGRGDRRVTGHPGLR